MYIMHQYFIEFQSTLCQSNMYNSKWLAWQRSAFRLTSMKQSWQYMNGILHQGSHFCFKYQIPGFLKVFGPKFQVFSRFLCAKF